MSTWEAVGGDFEEKLSSSGLDPATVTRLSITNCASFSGSALSSFPNVTHLSLKGCSVSGELWLPQSLQEIALTNTNIDGSEQMAVSGLLHLTKLELALDEDYAESFPSDIILDSLPQLQEAALRLCWIFKLSLKGTMPRLESLVVDPGQYGKADLCGEGLTAKSVYLQKRFPPEVQLAERDVVECIWANQARGGTPMPAIIEWLREKHKLPPEVLELDEAVQRVALYRAMAALAKSSKLLEKGYNKGAAYKLKPAAKRKLDSLGLEAALHAAAGKRSRS